MRICVCMRVFGCVRRFRYFVFVFHLVEPRELKALEGLTARIRKEYVPAGVSEGVRE